MSLNLNQLPDQISESPSLESLTVAETYSTLLNYHIRNAELNGALNILRKVVGNFDYDPIEVCSTPLATAIKQN